MTKLARRSVLAGCALAAVWTMAGAHTPYNQWRVFRRKHLLVLTHREDPTAHELGTIVASALARRLPESRAQVTRAPDVDRVASLLATDQLRFAVLHHREAIAMVRGEGPVKGHGPVPLRGLAVLDGTYIVVARADVPDRHAWQVARALDDDEANAELAMEVQPRMDSDHLDEVFGPVTVHPGAHAYYTGAPAPPQPVGDDRPGAGEHPHDHAH